ncbi:MAG: 50S ribosomal protein L9 [Burkholderiales bacterium]|jgi:large subunit ribosomal protein L9|nr:50S ribosomal protein L9 [Burkholderiales bacterium]
MQIILLEKVANLGLLGDVVRVKDGYARNFLIPSGLARRATEKAVAEFQARRVELEKVAADKLAAARAEGERLSALTLHVVEKSAVDGRLFGSVANLTLSEALKAQGFKVEKAMVRMPNGPIKLAGEHKVSVALHTDVVVDVKVVVEGDTN